MKIHPTTKPLNMRNAINVTPQCESPMLKINDTTFALFSKDEKQPFLVIESELFALFMKRIGNSTIHFMAHRHNCLCCGEEDQVVIRLTESDGMIYQFYENDSLELIVTMEKFLDETV